jgi:hypothetical protein
MVVSYFINLLLSVYFLSKKYYKIIYYFIYIILKILEKSFRRVFDYLLLLRR